MSVSIIATCGYFDSAMLFKNNMNISPKRIVSDFEIEFYNSGNGEIYIDSDTYPINSQTIIISKPGQSKNSKKSFTSYYLRVHDDGGDISKTIAVLPDCISIYDTYKYKKTFKRILKYFITPSDNLKCCAEFFSLLDMLFEDSRKMADHFEYNEKIHKAKNYIKANFKENLSLGDMARQAGYSSVYFHKLFLKYQKLTPREYLLSIRIAHAKYLLASSSMPAASVAYECGFSSQSYFNDVFKKITSLSPLNYRHLFTGANF